MSTPSSPVSPVVLSSNNKEEAKQNAEVCRVLKKIGYAYAHKITHTLQGSIWRVASNANKNGKYKTKVVKCASQYLYHTSRAIIHGKEYSVSEDILLEQAILKFLTQQKNHPKSIIKYHWFFKTNTDYYLVMDDGGISLYDFVTKAHRLISAGKITIAHWKTVTRLLLKQLLQAIEYIHSKNVCHFDISLENILINDIAVEVYNRDTKKEEIRFVLNDIQIKLCDFGLAQIFTDKKKFVCKHFCGKVQYKSPEVVSQKRAFHAKKNDIWCMGVCMFMICTGAAPWHLADTTDPFFANFMKGNLKSALKKWNVLHFMDRDWIYLFQSIFRYEKDRISLNEIKQIFAWKYV